jgi:hypothetical protein
LFQCTIKPRDPPHFSGEKGQDVITWLGMVDDYFAVTSPPTERQAVAYMILLLSGNARAWWQAEYQSRGYTRPDTVAELQMLLRAAFESPVREQRARTELLRLQQRSGENAATYMARTKALLTRVPGYDTKTVIQQWVLGLRQPHRYEVAKTYPRTLAEAETLVSRLEDAMEFAKSGRDDQTKQKQNKSGEGQSQNQQKKTWAGQGRGRGAGNTSTSSGGRGQGYQQKQGNTSSSQGQGNFNRGQGSSGFQYRPPQKSVIVLHPQNRGSGGSGQRGRGRKNQGRSRMATMAVSEELREMADQLDREAGQHPAGQDPDDSLNQSQGN